MARYWLESLAGLPCNVEVASEYRYRKHVVLPGTLLVTISQSGETADTLAALQQTKKLGYGHSLAICNVPESSLVRESELTLLTRAGPEIGVASTKAFVTQLTALLLLTIALARRHGLTAEKEKKLVEELELLPGRIQKVLELSDEIRQLSERFVDKQHALFLGRGVHYPIAMEGALKLKEISYIHAEAYAAGELKHGPLALVDADMPVDRSRAERRSSGKIEIEPAGSPRPRRRTVRVLRKRHRRTCQQHHQDPHARGGRNHLADSLHRAAATAGLLCRAGEGDGCGSAAKSRQVGDGRVSPLLPLWDKPR